MSRVFFCNSGAEANEAAIKLARLHGHRKSITNPKIVVFDGAFHGRTLAALTATGNVKAQAGFGPLVEGFLRLPYNDLNALHALADDSIVAILAEPLQGEGGVRKPDPGYLKAMRALCDQRGWMLMLDEVQTGMGRTGRWFAYQREDIHPDVLTLAKGLGNGFPIGACLARNAAAELFTPGTHGSTFGGNPLASAAALAVLETIEREDLCKQAERRGARLIAALETGLEGVSAVKHIRGLGLMVGVELDRPCGELVAAGLAKNILINVTAERVVRLLPPLISSDEIIDQIAATVAALIREFIARP